MPHKRAKPTRTKKFLIQVNGRKLAELYARQHDDPDKFIPGTVVWLCDPQKVTPAERERAAAAVVRAAKLDPKVSHELIYQHLWLKNTT